MSNGMSSRTRQIAFRPGCGCHHSPAGCRRRSIPSTRACCIQKPAALAAKAVMRLSPRCAAMRFSIAGFDGCQLHGARSSLAGRSFGILAHGELP